MKNASDATNSENSKNASDAVLTPILRIQRTFSDATSAPDNDSSENEYPASDTDGLTLNDSKDGTKCHHGILTYSVSVK